MNYETIQFQNQAGDTLSGHLHRPLGKPRAFVLFAHCFTCTANIKAALIIARALVQEGFAVLRFDFTGLGASEGEFADTNFSTNVDDLLAAAAYLATNHRAPEVLVGEGAVGASVELTVRAKTRFERDEEARLQMVELIQQVLIDHGVEIAE